MRRSGTLAGAAKIAVGAALVMLAPVIACNWLVSHSGGGQVDQAALSGTVRDVAIVPGCFAGRGRPAPMLRARLEAARWALKHGLVRAILVSGDEGGGEVTAMRTWLEDEGVDPSRILADPGGARTIVTMRNAAQFFRITSAIVCTQPISMNRSLYLARKNGIDAVGLAAEVDGPHNLRWLSAEAVKNTLAVVETAL